MPCRKRKFFVFRNLIFVMTYKKQTTRDFLSLYTDSGFQDSRPPSQGFFPKTRDFLQPLERAAADGGSQRRVPAEEAPVAAIAAPGELGSVEHVLTGRLGTCGAEHVRPVAVKPEWSTYAAGAAPAPAESAERREEPKRNAFTLWEEEVVWPAEGGVFAGKGTHQQQQQQWAHPSPFPASRGSANGSFPSIPSSREQLAAEDKGRPMVASSRSGVSFADGDDEGEEGFGREEKPYHKGITVKVDGSVSSRDDSSSKDQKPSTPRSKHSATEQRRRTKINDRFQILRDLIPHSDQKRDKASFLLEVIEYIQFLQEKVQKYESSSPGWNQANAKFMPWKSQVSGASIVDHSHTIKDHQASTGFIFPDDSSILNAPTITSNNQNPAESENIGAALASKSASMPLPMQYPVGAASGFSQPQMKFISDSESMAAQPHSQWLRSSVTDASVSTDVLSGHEELTVDEGTTSLSSLYSERLRTTLTEALQRTGVDISQASISVQINPHRRTASRQISSNKDKDDPLSTNQAGHSAVGNSGDESERASKRHKFDTS